MRYINTTDENITFTDVDGRVVIVPKNRVYTHFNVDTITFLLVERYESEGICLFTTRAEDLSINGVVYTFEQLLSGSGVDSMYSPTGLIIKLVDQLPTTGEDSTIYLVANDKGSYTEYIWLKDNSKWEELGDITRIDLSNYFTKDEINTMFADYYTKTEVDDELALKADTDNVYDKTTANSTFATQTVVNQEISGRIQADADLQSQINSKADKTDTYTKTQVDDALATKQNVGDYATNTALTDGLALKADKSDTYTKQQVDDAIASIDVSDQLANYETIANHNTDKQALEASIALKANSADLATVATSGSYNDLSNKPTIPDTTDFVTKAEYNPKEIAIAEALTDLNENKVDKATFEAKEVVISTALNELDTNKQDVLTAGTNITIENNVISATASGGGGMDEDTELLISTALVDLNDRKMDASEVKEKYQKKGDYATNTALATKANSTEVPTLTDYEEAQKITSYALNNLNARVEELDDEIGYINTLLEGI